MNRSNETGVAESLTFQHSSGSVECKICLSIHPSYTAYYSHAQGKQHLQNLALLQTSKSGSTKLDQAPRKKRFTKIGIPKYDVVKIRDPQSRQLGLRLTVFLEKISCKAKPQFQLLNAYEQTIEEVNTRYQYLVVAAEPYDSVALRIPASPIDHSKTLSHYNENDKTYCVQLLYDQM